MKIYVNKKTAKAHEASTEKWRLIARGEGRDKGRQNCALCRLFNRLACGCRPCTLALYGAGCTEEGSPFDRWYDHQCRDHFGYSSPRTPGCTTCTALAEAMYQHMLEVGRCLIVVPGLRKNYAEKGIA